MKNIPFNTATLAHHTFHQHPDFSNMYLLENIGGAKAKVVLELIRWEEAAEYCGSGLNLYYVNNGNLVNLDWSIYMDQTHSGIVMDLEDARILHERCIMLQNGFIPISGTVMNPRFLDLVLEGTLPVTGLGIYLRNGMLTNKAEDYAYHDLYIRPFDIARIKEAIAEWSDRDEGGSEF